MEKLEENPKQSEIPSLAKKLPAEIVGRFMQNLSVGERLKSERVSPRWKRALQKWGWTEQSKLNREIVFEGASAENIFHFWGNFDGESCQLFSLFECFGENLLELDLQSFGFENIEPFVPKMGESLQLLQRLVKLNIEDLDLCDFVAHLQPTLCQLKTSSGINIETLETLYLRCPNLEEVPFQNVEKRNLDSIFELVGRFPRQKILDLSFFSFSSKRGKGALASIGQLKELEKLGLWRCEDFDGDSLEAISEECQHLRTIQFNTSQLVEKALFPLASLPNLCVLVVEDHGGEFSDAVLKAIAQRGQLKKLKIYGPGNKSASDADDERTTTLTDASIVYLVDRCKSLISLSFFDCPHITERSLEAVLAEVRRRHGSPPRALPADALDAGIFYFNFRNTGITWGKARELVGNDNPWLSFDFDPRKCIF